ncbi:acyl-CoA synthetase [Aurantivibrio infirmus]
MSELQINFDDRFSKLNAKNQKTALTIGDDSYSYAELNQRINNFALSLLGDKNDLAEERIAFMISAGLDYVVSLFGIWRAGGIAIPLNTSSAIPELEHYLSCASVTRLLVLTRPQPELAELCASLSISIHDVKTVNDNAKRQQTGKKLPNLESSRRAMILFTSGTTNKPKGVVSTHGNICAQISSLIEAWAWQENDSIPLYLPMHHVHGIINILCSGLWAGATIDVYKSFEMEAILKNVVAGRYTVFMAVPTIYAKLIPHLESISEAEKDAICSGFKAMRLNISGSAACPVPIFEKWLALTEQNLLERYGMTEIGMAISNPYHGERRAGAVGVPLPGVEVALFDEDNIVITKEDTPGEIRIKGPTVFLEYWDNPTATKESFHEGWFCTGDVAVIENGYYRIMGRSSIDIIKSGGYKLSALEIEGVLLNHEKISECAVIGVSDDTWGEAVTAFLVLTPNTSLTLDALKDWCKERMSAYKIPKNIKIVDSLPRNAMGKVTKKLLRDLV